jgi:phage-related protein
MREYIGGYIDDVSNILATANILMADKTKKSYSLAIEAIECARKGIDYILEYEANREGTW